jgi:uncharacterized SAM-binding protein YcdF (DUF218 family)
LDTLFFIVAKVVGALLLAETWLLILAVLAAWSVSRARFVAARRFIVLLVAMILCLGTLPIGDLLLRPLEYEQVEIGSDPIDGVIVLGGGEDVGASVASGLPQLGDGADRYITALMLAGRPEAPVILFAGGGGRLRDIAGAEVSEAEIARRIFLGQGISPDRLILEDRSRNTAENAARAAELVSPETGERWALVTSAFHMQRALRSFEAAGWADLIPQPTDYRARLWSDGLGWSFARNLQVLNTAVREWVGRAAYAMTGR